MSFPWEDDWGGVAVESDVPWEDTFAEAPPEPDLVFGAPQPAPVQQVDSLAPVRHGQPIEPAPAEPPAPAFVQVPLPPDIPRLPAPESQDTLAETSPGFVTRLQQALPSVFGEPGEKPPGSIPRGALPALAQVLIGRETEPGERPEPGLLRFSPKELIPPEPTVGGEIARQAIGMVNLENLGIIRGLGVLAKGAGAIANWAKAATAGYFGKTGAEIAGQSGGELSAGGLTPTEQGERAFNVGLGGLMALGPMVPPIVETARIRPTVEPPTKGSALRMPRPAVPVRMPIQLPDAARVEPPPGVVVPKVEPKVEPVVSKTEPAPAPKAETPGIPTNLAALEAQAAQLRAAIEKGWAAPRLTEMHGQRIKKLANLEARIAKLKGAEPAPKAETPAAPASPTAKEPWQMTKAEFVKEFSDLERRVAGVEKTPDRRMTEEEVAFWRKDWKAYSRRRGYTEAEIEEFDRWLKLNLPFEELVPEGESIPLVTPDNIHATWVRKAREEGKPVPPEVLKDYPDLAPKAEPPAPPVAPKPEPATSANDFQSPKPWFPDATRSKVIAAINKVFGEWRELSLDDPAFTKELDVLARKIGYRKSDRRFIDERDFLHRVLTDTGLKERSTLENSKGMWLPSNTNDAALLQSIKDAVDSKKGSLKPATPTPAPAVAVPGEGTTPIPPSTLPKSARLNEQEIARRNEEYRWLESQPDYQKANAKLKAVKAKIGNRLLAGIDTPAKQKMADRLSAAEDSVAEVVDRLLKQRAASQPTTAPVQKVQAEVQKVEPKLEPPASPIPQGPGGAMPPGPGAASPSEFAQRQATAGRKPPPPNPPVTTEPGELPTPEVVRQNRDYHLFNRLNSPQWVFYFGRLGQAAKAAWETMVMGEFNMRESALRDVRALVVDPLKSLPRKLRRKGGQALFDALNGKDMDQIASEWSQHPEGARVIAQAEKIKTRLEEIRTTIRDLKRESFRRYLGGLKQESLSDLYEKNMAGEARGRSKEEMADALVLDQFPDDWGIADGSYLPHLFFGQWKVTARLPGSDSVSFVTRSQTVQEAKARIYEQVKANPELAKADFTIAQDFQIPADMIRIGDRQFWKLVGDMKKQNLDADAIKTALQGKIGRKASKQKWFGSLVHREGFEGYSRDYARVMTAYLNGFHRWRVLSEVNRKVQPLIETVRSEGRVNAADRLQDLMDNLWGKPTAANRQFDAFIRRVPVLRDVVKPLALDRWARAATQMAGMLTLRTLRFSVVNRLQPLQGLYPLIGERGIIRAKLLQHSEAGRRLLDEAGVTLDPGQYASELAGRSSRRSMVERFSGERSNQELAFLAMYEHGRTLGLDHAKAIEYGKLRGQLMTQFTPLITDTPQLFEGPLGRVMFQFKRFPVKQVELIARMVADRNAPALARLVASFATIGGLSFFLRQTWMTDPDTRLRLKRELDKSLGQKGADTLMYGLPGFLGADLSGSIVLGDEPFGKNLYEKAARQLAGPALSLSVEAARTLTTPERAQTTTEQDAASLLRRFPTTRPLAELSALWNQDYDLRTPDGETKLRRKLSDVLMGLGSFRSANEANVSLAINGIIALAKRESELKNNWYVATDRTAARNEISAFNKLWPEAAITYENLEAYAKYRDRTKGQTDATRIARKKFQSLLPTHQRNPRNP